MKTLRSEFDGIAVVPLDTRIHRGNDLEFLSDTSTPPIYFFWYS